MTQLNLGKMGVALIDDEDFERLSKHRWYARKHHTGRLYAFRKTGGAPTIEMLHHAVLGSRTPVDHINGDSLDNRRENLRPATQQQNASNRGKFRGQRHSRFKGVTLVRGKRWQAQIRVNSKQRHLGYFDSEQAAAQAYDAAAVAAFGQFARTNEMLGLYAKLGDA